MTSVDEFAAITRRIIESEGANEFLPTALYPERQEVVALDALPETEDRVDLATEWASSRARRDEEFMLAIIVAPDQFILVHRRGDNVTRRSFAFEAAA